MSTRAYDRAFLATHLCARCTFSRLKVDGVSYSENYHLCVDDILNITYLISFLVIPMTTCTKIFF